MAIQIGIDPQQRDRCYVSVPVDTEYMKQQRDILNRLIESDEVMTPEERRQMQHLLGFMDHFVFKVFHVAAEYPTANRTVY